MGKLSALGRKIGERARAAAAEAEAAQAGKVTTKDYRAARASWGTVLLQLSQLLGTIGASLLTGAYEDAESTVSQEHDRGYEQRRHDEAETRAAADVDEHQDQAADVDDHQPAGYAAAAERYEDAPPGVTRTWAPTIEGGAEPAAAADET